MEKKFFNVKVRIIILDKILNLKVKNIEAESPEEAKIKVWSLLHDSTKYSYFATRSIILKD